METASSHLPPGGESAGMLQRGRLSMETVSRVGGERRGVRLGHASTRPSLDGDGEHLKLGGTSSKAVLQRGRLSMETVRLSTED